MKFYLKFELRFACDLTHVSVGTPRTQNLF